MDTLYTLGSLNLTLLLKSKLISTKKIPKHVSGFFLSNKYIISFVLLVVPELAS